MAEVQLEAVLAVLEAVKKGDLSARVPVGTTDGTVAAIAAELNDLVSRLQARSAGAPRAAAADCARLLSGRKILVIDDDASRVFALGSLLDDGGARLLWAEDVRGGVSLLNRHPDVDLVVIDAARREVDVREVTREIRALPRRRALPVIAVTEPADDVRLFSLIQQCMAHGARANARRYS